MFKRALNVALILAGGYATAPAQNTPGARELFYAGTAPKENLAPIRKAAAPAPPAKAPKTTAPGASRAPGNTPSQPQASAIIPAAYTTPAPAPHLGLRYSLVLVDAASGKAVTVDASRNFRKGECFALDLEANRSGYLYVLARQSSGNWMPLFPSPGMTDESNVINPGQKVRVPARYCFEISDPPGTEKLFVMLSRDPREAGDLDEGIRPSDNPAPAGKAGLLQIADARLVNNAVARFSEASYSRDLVIRKVGDEAPAQGPAHSVYVVNASNSPASRVVVQIEVTHR